MCSGGRHPAVSLCCAWAQRHQGKEEDVCPVFFAAILGTKAPGCSRWQGKMHHLAFQHKCHFLEEQCWHLESLLTSFFKEVWEAQKFQPSQAKRSTPYTVPSQSQMSQQPDFQQLLQGYHQEVSRGRPFPAKGNKRTFTYSLAGHPSFSELTAM